MKIIKRWGERLSGKWRRLGRGLRWFTIGLLLLLVALRFALPSLLKSYVNRQIAKSPNYEGAIGEVSVHLWRGAYRINDVKIIKTSGAVPEPLFAAAAVDLSLQWRELFHGALVGEVAMERPQINFVAGPTDEQSQTGDRERWDRLLESLFPFQLNRLEFKGGEVRFRNHFSTPPVNVFINELMATATNLSNSRNLSGELPSGVNAKGKTIGGGGIELQLQLNPMAPAPTYEVIASVTNVDLVSLNDFLQAYGKFDVERGVFSLYTSVASKAGTYDGYLKVFFENLDVFAWEKERKKNALQIFWQGIVGTLTTAFKNHPDDSLATRVPISGTYAGTDVGVWAAVLNMLRHAFVRALVPKLDEKVKVEEVEEKIDPKDGKTDTERKKAKADADKNTSSKHPSRSPSDLKGAQILNQP